MAIKKAGTNNTLSTSKCPRMRAPPSCNPLLASAPTGLPSTITGGIRRSTRLRTRPALFDGNMLVPVMHATTKRRSLAKKDGKSINRSGASTFVGVVIPASGRTVDPRAQAFNPYDQALVSAQAAAPSLRQNKTSGLEKERDPTYRYNSPDVDEDIEEYVSDSQSNSYKLSSTPSSSRKRKFASKSADPTYKDGWIESDDDTYEDHHLPRPAKKSSSFLRSTTPVARKKKSNPRSVDCMYKYREGLPGDEEEHGWAASSPALERARRSKSQKRQQLTKDGKTLATVQKVRGSRLVQNVAATPPALSPSPAARLSRVSSTANFSSPTYSARAISDAATPPALSPSPTARLSRLSSTANFSSPTYSARATSDAATPLPISPRGTSLSPTSNNFSSPSPSPSPKSGPTPDIPTPPSCTPSSWQGPVKESDISIKRSSSHTSPGLSPPVASYRTKDKAVAWADSASNGVFRFSRHGSHSGAIHSIPVSEERLKKLSQSPRLLSGIPRTPSLARFSPPASPKIVREGSAVVATSVVRRPSPRPPRRGVRASVERDAAPGVPGDFGEPVVLRKPVRGTESASALEIPKPEGWAKYTLRQKRDWFGGAHTSSGVLGAFAAQDVALDAPKPGRWNEYTLREKREWFCEFKRQLRRDVEGEGHGQQLSDDADESERSSRSRSVSPEPGLSRKARGSRRGGRESLNP